MRRSVFSPEGCPSPAATDHLIGRSSQMPRYFMHIRDGRAKTPDEEGFEAGNLHQAQIEARRLIRTLIVRQMEEGRGPGGQFVELRDEKGHIQDVITFKDVLRQV